MKRRDFVRQSAALAGSQVVGETLSAASQTSQVQLPVNTTRLFDPAANTIKTTVQDFLFWDGVLYSLYFDNSRTFGVSATGLSGTRLWQFTLPKGIYTNLGIHNGGLTIQAVNYGSLRTPCIISVDGAGATGVISALPSNINRTWFAGDSLLLNRTPTAVELWGIGASVAERIASSAFDLSGPVRGHLTNPAEAVLIRTDGSRVISVPIPSCELQSSMISIPEVQSALTQFTAINAQITSGKVGVPVVFPATGTDSAGSLYGLIVPNPTARLPIAKFNTSGQGSVWCYAQLPPGCKAPAYLVVQGTSFGIACADGQLVQYSV